MPTLLIQLKKNKLLFVVLLAVLLTGFVWHMLVGKAGCFIALNGYHPFWLNVFFINYTFTGDGIFAICLIAFYFFWLKKKDTGFMLLYGFLISGAAVQIIKNVVHADRPKLFFEHGQYLFFIDGVTLSNQHSFPSGHTATAFAIATVFILIAKNNWWNFLLLAGAFLAAYSRIYLAQHFLPDVIIGAAIGVGSSLLAYILVSKGYKVLLPAKTKAYSSEGNIAYP